MPEHFHLLRWPSEAANPSPIMQKLEERTAKFILKTLRANLGHPWCGKMLERFKLPPSVDGQAPCRVWQRKFYDLNVWSEKKQSEKLSYVHNNPVKGGLVKEPGDWPYSSWRWYYLGDASLLPIDPAP